MLGPASIIVGLVRERIIGAREFFIFLFFKCTIIFRSVIASFSKKWLRNFVIFLWLKKIPVSKEPSEML